MRKVLILLTIVVIIPVFCLKCHAEDRVDDYITRFEEILPDEFSGINDNTDELIDRVGIESLFNRILSALSENISDASAFFMMLVGFVALTALSSLLPGKTQGGSEVVISLISSVSIFSVMLNLFDSVHESVGKLCDFFGSLIPITVGIIALGGGSSGAGVQAAGMYTTLSLVGGVGQRLFSSIAALALALGLLSSFGNEGVLAVSRGVKSLFMWLIGIFSATLTGALSLQTLVASAADSATIRAARYAASGLIPVVGSTVSSALSTLASGISFAKGIVGGGAIAVILFMALTPLVMLLLYRLALSLGLILCDFVGASVSGGIFTSFRSSLDMLISIYSLSALIFLFEILLFIRTGVAIL